MTATHHHRGPLVAFTILAVAAVIGFGIQQHYIRDLHKVQKENKALIVAVAQSRVKGCEQTNARFSAIAAVLRSVPPEPNRSAAQKVAESRFYAALAPVDCSKLPSP